MIGAELRSVLRGLRDGGRVPALSAAAGRGGEVVWSEVAHAPWAGTPTAEHAFRIASITKPMLAVAVMRLVEEGKVALHDPIGAHLPDAPAADATIAELLSHTSGLPAEPAGAWWERAGGSTWEQIVASRLPRLVAPGIRYHYSNVGYAVLGRLVEVARGRAWDEVLRDELWTPLGMTATGRVPVGPHVRGYAVHPDADLVHDEPVAEYLAMGPAGELWSTPADLVRFGVWLAGHDTLGAAGDAVLPDAARRLMTAPRVVVDEPGAAWTGTYGLGVRIRKDLVDLPGTGTVPVRTVGHSGSVPGFTADLRVDVETGDAVAVVGSSTGGFGDGTGLLAALLSARPAVVRGPSPAGRASAAGAQGGAGTGSASGAVPGPEESVGARVLDVTGTWYWGPVPYTLRAEDGRLALTGAAGRRSTEFAPGATSGEWVGVTAGYWHGEILRPVERDGRVVALDVGTFCLTRTPYAPDAEIPGGHDTAGWYPL
ncbi:CubicO group peptidase, beta-lactamase class C family [Promicromonospora umidemergens]|uniref:Serine hydrolase domain-containing protein n=1 Tax=Promicromonospora umidemergens TaxID=629679 RepID=A0ABP8YD75_9MICO|nr:CubicO group peptidase, beta-lactamase class C family [Promicromonospora umidemergens]